MLDTLSDEGPDRFAFSFSGLKTAVLRAVRASDDLARDRANLARGFQDAAVAVLAAKVAAAREQLGYPTVVLAGGVACNVALRAAVQSAVGSRVRVAVASKRLNTDNAAMIGAAGLFHLRRGEQHGLDLQPDAGLPFPGLVTAFPQPSLTR